MAFIYRQFGAGDLSQDNNQFDERRRPTKLVDWVERSETQRTSAFSSLDMTMAGHTPYCRLLSLSMCDAGALQRP